MDSHYLSTHKCLVWNIEQQDEDETMSAITDIYLLDEHSYHY